jgi:hypothetical protein
MKYILESSQFEESQILDIIDRIQKTGYISKSSSQKLQELTGVIDFDKKIIARISTLNSFFKKYNVDYIEDVMLSIFDNSEYDFKVQLGIEYTGNKTYYPWNFSNSKGLRPYDNDFNTILPNNVQVGKDNTFLMTFILKFISKLYNKEIQLKKELKEQRRKEKFG